VGVSACGSGERVRERARGRERGKSRDDVELRMNRPSCLPRCQRNTIVLAKHMSSAEQISILLRAEDLRWAEERARRELKSVSAVVAEALHRQRQAEARARLLLDLGTDHITERQRNLVRSEGRTPKQARPRRKRRRIISVRGKLRR
jgi:hypothetical protein